MSTNTEPLELIPHMTVSGRRRAMQYSTTGIAVEAHYIGVGKGFQEIELDDLGNAITDTLADHVAWIPILTAQDVSDSQKEMFVDLVGWAEGEWNFSECVLADADKKPIAIFGSSSQALISVTPFTRTAMLSLNLLFATIPANSITIVHQNAPLEIFNMRDTLAMCGSIGQLALTSMKQGLNALLPPETALSVESDNTYFNRVLLPKQQQKQHELDQQTLIMELQQGLQVQTEKLSQTEGILQAAIDSMDRLAAATSNTTGQLGLTIMKQELRSVE